MHLGRQMKCTYRTYMYIMYTHHNDLKYKAADG